MTSFEKFHEAWHGQLRELVQEMNKAPRPATNQKQQELHTNLIHKVTSHYNEYYRVKSLVAKTDVFYVFAAPWSSSLERSLYWIAGWRPTIAFHIIYSESAVLFESDITDILNGCRKGNLGDLSPDQLSQFSELQCETIQQENGLSEELSDWQDSGNDIIGNIDEKIERLMGIVGRADQLRLKTIENLLQLLTTQQAVEFLIAMVRLFFGICCWDINQDPQPTSKGSVG